MGNTHTFVYGHWAEREQKKSCCCKNGQEQRKSTARAVAGPSCTKNTHINMLDSFRLSVVCWSHTCSFNQQENPVSSEDEVRAALFPVVQLPHVESCVTVL